MRKILRGRVFIKNILFTLCLGFSFLFEAHAQVSGTFTINSAVATGGSNFQTFSAAVAFLAGGVNGPVIFNVTTATYNEQIIMGNIAGTSAANTITFNCNGATLTFLSTTTGQRAGVKLNNTDYVTFDNLTVVPQATTNTQFGYGFHLLNDADHNTIKNCRINNNVNTGIPPNNEGIVINGNNGYSTQSGNSFCDENLIQANTINGGYTGITLYSQSSTPVLMVGNRIEGNVISNCLYYGIYMQNTTGTVINGNEIAGGPSAINDFTGIYFKLKNQSLSITRNKIHSFHATNSGSSLCGIYITSESELGKEVLIANNLIYDFQGDGSQYGIYSKGIQTVASGNYLNIYNNTISLDDQNVYGMETYGLYLEAVTDVNMTNNIISITRPTVSNNYGIFFENTPVNFSARNNNYYIPAGLSSICAIGFYGGSAYDLIDQWRAVSGYDNFSTVANPAYANLAAFDFRPTAQAIDNMGTPLPVVTTDINATARNIINPDAGCFEYNSANCSTPVIGGTTGVMGDSILCLGPKVSFNLLGNSAGTGQTYIWQASTSSTGPFSAVTGSLAYPAYEVTPTVTNYYRVAVTCGATTAYSTPIRVLVNTTLNAGTYTINNTLPTGGVNFNSFRDAALALQCGLNGSVVFNVASGSTFNEQLIIPAINTSPAKTVTFNGNGATISYLPTDISQTAVVKLNDADYITIDSLNVIVQENTTADPFDDFGFGIQMINNADHNTIKRCNVNLPNKSTTLSYAGIVINPSDYEVLFDVSPSNCDTNSIINNTVTGGYYGIASVSTDNDISVQGSIGNIIKGNFLKDNCRYGILVAGNTRVLVDGNDISLPTRTVFSADAFVGVFLFANNWDVNISNNKVHDLLEKVRNSILELDGIRIEKCSTSTVPIVVSNNMMYNFRGNGWQYGIIHLTSANVKYYNNTVSLEDTISFSTGVARGFGEFGSVTSGLEFKNNNIVVRRGGNGEKTCMYLTNYDPGFLMDYNNYYVSSDSGSRNAGFMNGVYYATVANWQTTGKDANTISVDPVHNDIPNGDLTPTKIPFENKGITIAGITTDINGAVRNATTPDIGAIEFTICRQLANPVVTIEEAGPNTIKFAWTAISNTSGYRVSLDGINWSMPSSGAKGTSHVVVGLNPMDSVTLAVKALGSRVDCPEYITLKGARAQTNQLFIPNTFTPNGNGQDDYFKVYTTVMKSVHWMVYNQWGTRVFETTDLNGQWDGNYKSKPQPVGVYVYVVVGTLQDGTKVTQKGTFNLIR